MTATPRFRAVRSDSDGAHLLHDQSTEGPALLAVLDELARARRRLCQVDELPALNNSGCRRWRIFSADRTYLASVYLEPVGDARTLAADWLQAAQYPEHAGWWVRDRRGLTQQFLDQPA